MYQSSAIDVARLIEITESTMTLIVYGHTDLNLARVMNAMFTIVGTATTWMEVDTI